eukprot:TRINITY_DN6768_c0_g1_i2.p1 TRINITY_DN6768_c0_g1~~TRINITY_DN6768_c0_g1_i2.p1  ORF type:complete len:443 (-),score=59.05 TRINITY_DN6768_c0_g1_i2:41-1369(-)
MVADSASQPPMCIHQSQNIILVQFASSSPILLAVVTMDGYLGIWNTSNSFKNPSREMWKELLKMERITCMAFSPSCHSFAVVAWDGAIQVYERQKDEGEGSKISWQGYKREYPYAVPITRVGNYLPNLVLFSPNGEYVYVTTSGKCIILHLRSGRKVVTDTGCVKGLAHLSCQDGPPRYVTYHSNQTLTLHRWPAMTTTLNGEWRVHSSIHGNLIYDGELMVEAHNRDRIPIPFLSKKVFSYACDGMSTWTSPFRVAPGRIAILHQHSLFLFNRMSKEWQSIYLDEEPISFSFTSQGQHVVTMAPDGRVQVWHSDTCQSLNPPYLFEPGILAGNSSDQFAIVRMQDKRCRVSICQPQDLSDVTEHSFDVPYVGSQFMDMEKDVLIFAKKEVEGMQWWTYSLDARVKQVTMTTCPSIPSVGPKRQHGSEVLDCCSRIQWGRNL